MRTKTVFPTNEVAHIWAKQSQNEGRNSTGNVYFEGKKIFSYGRHFCMGRIIDNNTVALTDRSYSNTTAKHLHHVRYAVNHFTNQIYIPYPEGKISDSGNASGIIDRIKTQLDIIGNSRKKAETKERAKNELAFIVRNVEQFAAATGEKLNGRWYERELQKKFKIYFKAAKSEKAAEELGAKLNRLAVEKKKAETAKQKQAIENWKNGHGDSLYFSDTVYLRVVNAFTYDNGTDFPESKIETSKGARVSLKAAKILFDMIQGGKDIRGYQIDGYTVIGINGVLTIGCHKIERAEIERFAKTQNWI